MAMELPPKIENTSEFASMIKQLRLNHGYPRSRADVLKTLRWTI